MASYVNPVYNSADDPNEGGEVTGNGNGGRRRLEVNPLPEAPGGVRDEEVLQPRRGQDINHSDYESTA